MFVCVFILLYIIGKTDKWFKYINRANVDTYIETLGLTGIRLTERSHICVAIP